ncbi:E3 ubiquitin-protein ligase Dma1p [Diutina catenulata]
MANSPTIGNLHEYTQPPPGHRDVTLTHHPVSRTSSRGPEPPTTLHIGLEHGRPSSESSPSEDQSPPPPGAGTGPAAPVPAPVAVPVAVATAATDPPTPTTDTVDDAAPADKDGFYSVRLTPIIDHSSNSSGLYFSPVIRKIQPASLISIGRYTEKNKAAAHAPQGSSAPIVFKSKVVSRTHALFQCNADGQWFLKDCKSSSGTFLNHIRLSKAGEESMLMPLLDGDIIQLGMDYRGGTEEVYRCVKMRCEFNKSWQRKVNQFNLEIHKKMQNLSLQPEDGADPSECAICLMKIEPCQAIFMSPCSHSWHYKCIRPIIIKSYPQFYCPNCRTMCDLETDIEDDD